VPSGTGVLFVGLNIASSRAPDADRIVVAENRRAVSNSTPVPHGSALLCSISRADGGGQEFRRPRGSYSDALVTLQGGNDSAGQPPHRVVAERPPGIHGTTATQRLGMNVEEPDAAVCSRAFDAQRRRAGESLKPCMAARVAAEEE
jgi:hypothetical protein